MAKEIPNKVRKVNLTVVGMQHRVTITTRRFLVDHLPIKVRLEREPENLADENAIKVVIEDNFDIPYRDMHVGYLRRSVAEEWSLPMDAGKLKIVEAWITELDPSAGKGNVFIKFKTDAKFRSTEPEIQS